MATPAELFDEIAEMLLPFCDNHDVVINVKMDFEVDPFGLAIIRHISDPDDLFDTSRDTVLALTEDQLAFIHVRVKDYFEIAKGWKNKLLCTTLSVHAEGTLSFGSVEKERQ